MRPKNFKFQALHISILLILIYLVIFLKIDTYHIRWWDESLFVVNTYEMLHNKIYFSLYTEGVPDLINTKPPMVVWLQLFFVKFLGYNELAVRLPSVLAATISIVVVFLFIDKRFGKMYAWLSALVLLTSEGYIGFHAARTADSDSILSLFLLLASIYFIKFIEGQNPRLILCFFLFITLAFFTKMYAGLLFIPGYIIILLRHRKFREFTFNYYFLSGLFLFIACGIGTIYLREIGSPGYLKEIFYKDAGRIFNVVEEHNPTWEFYFDNLIFSRFGFWFIFLLVGIIFSTMNRLNRKESLFMDLFILVASYLVILSISVTKLEWYDIPLYPFLSILAAYGIYKAFENRVNFLSLNRKSITVLVVIFTYPYWIMFRKSQANIIPNGEKKLEASERFLFLKSNEKSNLSGTKVYYCGWHRSLLFYKYKFAEKGEAIELVSTADFFPNDKVLVSNDSLFDIVKSKYKFSVLSQEGPAKLLKIEKINDRLSF